MGLRDLPPVSYAAIRFADRGHRSSGSFSGRVDYCRRASDYVLLAFTGVVMFAVNYGLLLGVSFMFRPGLAAVLQATIQSLAWCSPT